MVLRCRTVLLVFVVLAWFSHHALADEGVLASVLVPGADLQVSNDLLRQVCLQVEQLESARPILPTTLADETFVLCALADGVVGLSYSDGALVLVQIEGASIVEAMTGDQQAAEEPVLHAGMEIYPSVALAVDRENERAWLLASSHLHAHLFLFEHPLLAEAGVLSQEPASDQLLPQGVEIGINLVAARDILGEACPFHEECQVAPPMLPGPPEQQVQLNCFGLSVFGFPRKVELIFADGRLELVWILTGAEEERRVQSHLSNLYGAHVEEHENYMVWPDGLALRRDVTEIMVASPPVAAVLVGQ